METAGEVPNNSIQLVECPRDAMQGWKSFIPTEQKIEYLRMLLQVGFHTLDFGSFVSPKAIPQMADTVSVLRNLDPGSSKTKLLAIVANTRGAEEASAFEQISYLGFPFSVSETFQQRNTDSSRETSLVRVTEIMEICRKTGKDLVVYLSMGFGNPYGDAWSPEIVFEWASTIASLGVHTISLADTVGLATPGQVYALSDHLIRQLAEVKIGVHLHATPENRKEKLDAAFRAGCRRFDGAINGIGGCPMAGDELVGNMATECILDYFTEKKLDMQIDRDALNNCIRLAAEIFV